jgi:hypothetical protein
MHFLSIAKDYLVWHYSRAYSDIVHIWWNYLWFVNHLFSVPDVFMTWLAPWRRLQEEEINIVKDPQGYFANLFINLIMRIVGFVMRTALLAIALSGFVIIFALGASFLLLWTLLPILIVVFFLNSIRFLFA